MKKLLLILITTFIMLIGTAQAQSWASLVKEGNATYVGGFYAAVSYACLRTNYTNNSGVWASGKATIPYEKGCVKSLLGAIINKVTLPIEDS